MPRYLVRSPQIRTLMDGDEADVGTVVVTQPGNDWAVVEIEGTEEEAAQKIEQAAERGQIMEATPENTFRPLGIINPPETARPLGNNMGEDLVRYGVTPPWQEFVKAGEQAIIGIADTGHPTQAARDAHYPDVEIVQVYGGGDTHGHETACVSRMVGPRGVLPACRRVISGQALPNGSGSTTTVTMAIRAVAQWRGPNGEKVHCINLSLGGPPDPVIDGEVRAAQAAGVPCCAAAGNDGPSAQKGSPFLSAMFSAGATLYDGSRSASFSSGDNMWPEQTAAGPGQDVGLAHLDGGYGTGAGTSFVAPPFTAIIAGLIAAGRLSASQARSMMLERQQPIMRSGSNTRALKGRLDLPQPEVGQPPDTGGGEINLPEALARLEAIRGECDREGLRFWDVRPGTPAIEIEAFARDIQRSLGIIHAHSEIATAALQGKATGPVDPPPPPPVLIKGHGGTYPGHDPAKDIYPNGEWGPHHGWELKAPVPGRVETYVMQTPLGSLQALEDPRAAALFNGWTCCDWGARYDPANIDPQQAMYVAVFWPDSPLPLADGTSLRAVWFGHVRQDIRAGRVEAGGVICVAWDSGIRFESRGIQARAAHVHTCGDRNGQLTPNGTVNGFAVWAAMGYAPAREHPIPGPNEYMSGNYIAGKFRSEWVGREMPVLPTP